MVSTRQMATSSGNGTVHQNSATSDSARLSVVTAQTQRGMIAGASIVSTIVATRQCGHHQNNQQTQQQEQQQLVSVNESIVATDENAAGTKVELLDLPIEILAKIFSYVEYRKVGQLRAISRKMNEVCMDVLNSTFSRLITQTYNRFHAIKANMPRRESARRNHPLACECDIIETCYMRLSLLQMSFGKHIERGHCCFFPGAILDEVYNILNYIRNTPRLERPYRVTDELFDLSTMAMEYFRDRIEKTLPDIAYFNKAFYKLPTTTKRPALVASVDHADSSSSSPPQSNMVLRKGIRKIKQGMKIYNNQLSVLRNELRTCKRKSSEQGKQIAEQQKLLAEQQKQTLEYANRLDENDKKNEEMARKFSTLLQELNKCKTELQYWRSKSPAIPICTSCGQKLAPLLPPPEDFQALVNQGVKPEDIILNLSDDIENDTEANTIENGISTHSTTQTSVFAFPDKETTAKLLAVNSIAAKNQQLKRQHSSTSAGLTYNASNEGNSAFNIYASSSSTGGGNNSNCCSCQLNNSDNHPVGMHSNAISSNKTPMESDTSNCSRKQTPPPVKLLPSEMTNRLHYVRGANVIRTTTSAASNGNNISHENHTITTINKNISDVEPIAVGGLIAPPNLGRTHRSVIVSPAMRYQTNTGGNHCCLHLGMSGARNTDGVSADDVCIERDNSVAALASKQLDVSVEVNGVGVGGKQQDGGGVSSDETATTDVVSLQAITSQETKKARRVQKATRCLNGSGKRSK
uniref:F-box only protein 28 n=3 Tax=Ceratitis capitata TaxID=7213 RepID=W8ASN7_CERCA